MNLKVYRVKDGEVFSAATKRVVENPSVLYDAETNELFCYGSRKTLEIVARGKSDKKNLTLADLKELRIDVSTQCYILNALEDPNARGGAMSLVRPTADIYRVCYGRIFRNSNTRVLERPAIFVASSDGIIFDVEGGERDDLEAERARRIESASEADAERLKTCLKVVDLSDFGLDVDEQCHVLNRCAELRDIEFTREVMKFEAAVRRARL